MSNRFDNKKLLYLLAGLIAILLLTVVVKIPKESATIKTKLIDIDTLDINKIILYSKDNKGIPVEFNKKDNKWTVRQGGIISDVQKGAVKSLIAEAVNIKPQSLVTKDKSKWNEYELTDSLGTRIKFLSKKEKVLADIMIGKVNIKQVNNPYGGYGGNNITGTSFVRLYDGNAIYAADGFLQFSFNRKFEDWRDKTFIKSDKNSITNVKFIYPADSSFSLNKEGMVWHVNSKTADSVNVANYISSLGLLEGENIINSFKPDLSPVYQIVVEGNNLSHFTIKCYKDEGANEYVMNSSLNPEVYFTSAKNGIFDKLFKPLDYFEPGQKLHK